MTASVGAGVVFSGDGRRLGAGLDDSDRVSSGRLGGLTGGGGRGAGGSLAGRGSTSATLASGSGSSGAARGSGLSAPAG